MIMENSRSEVSVALTGDSFMTRRLPQGGYDGFAELKELLAESDVRFCNLEMTIHEGEAFPAAFSGGTWAYGAPEILDDLNAYGFNVYNTANNHSGDFSHSGMLATIRHLKERGMLFAGTGKNLSEASSPVYVETPHARVALIACTSSFHDSDMAGNQGVSMPGRPGLNPLRYKKVFHVEKTYFDMLSEVARKTAMNAAMENEIALGYKPPLPEGMLYFNGMQFVLDTETKMHTEPLKKDVERIEKAIREAKRQADYVFVSHHSHTFEERNKDMPAEFRRIFAHACIDAGADAYIGHGPHILQGIEIYKGKAVFHSLGNFIFETETVALQPAEAYENAGLAPDTDVGEYMSVRSKNGTRGFAVQEDIWRTVVASFTEKDGSLAGIRLYPVSLGMGEPRGRLGVPRLSHDEKTLERLAELSKPFGTEIVIANGEASVVLK